MPRPAVTCPSCGQVLPGTHGKPLTPAELDALSAWWHTGNMKRAADLLSRSERTVINQLASARIRNGVHTTLELLQLHIGELRSMSDLLTSHKVATRKAA
jgi:DNA-binding CsgD family transcriptional regulator